MLDNKILKLLTSICLLLVFLACSYERVGPSGQDGLDGLNGVDGKNGEEAYVFEYNIDFIAPDYRSVITLPSDFNMLDSDVIMVFLLWENDDGTDIWRALPQQVFRPEGTLAYNFDFTINDVAIYLEGNYPLVETPSFLLEAWTARIVVIPGQFTNTRSSKPLGYRQWTELEDHYNLLYPEF